MNAHYKPRHEPLLYFKPKGSTLRWCGDGKQNTLWNIPRDSSNIFHPTQKPIALAYKAIANHTSQSILDPFMGAGSTGIAATQLGRKFIGIELDPKYFDTACKRIEASQRQGVLFQPKPQQKPNQNKLISGRS